MATIPYWENKSHLLLVPFCLAVGTPAWHPGSTPASALRLGAAAEGLGRGGATACTGWRGTARARTLAWTRPVATWLTPMPCCAAGKIRR